MLRTSTVTAEDAAPSRRTALVVGFPRSLKAAARPSSVKHSTRPASTKIRTDRVVLALERLMGLILVAVSVEMMIRGIKSLVIDLGR